MKNHSTMTLMAGAFIMALHGQSSAQSADCPCGDPAGLVPLSTWSSNLADCAASGPMTESTPTRTELYGFSFEGGVVSLSSTIFGRDCRYVINAADLDIQKRPISKTQVDACSNLILNYAQALKDAGQVTVGDFGCNLR